MQLIKLTRIVDKNSLKRKQIPTNTFHSIEYVEFNLLVNMWGIDVGEDNIKVDVKQIVWWAFVNTAMNV